MLKIRCNCGQNEIIFRRLNLEDFPNGFEDECCKQKKKALETVVGDLTPQVALGNELQKKNSEFVAGLKRRGRPKRDSK